LQRRCLLPFSQQRQQHDMTVGKLQRVVMDSRSFLVDLTEDSRAVAVLYRSPRRS